ncbi:MAG: hypothetical protein WBM50_18880 [Acidimicrobiales bacterium]
MTDTSIVYEPVEDWCRHWVDAKHDKCHRPAVIIVWGKLADPEELGPLCREHLPDWIDMARLDGYAVFDLRKLRRAVTVVHPTPA